jgi:DUF971 family protein
MSVFDPRTRPVNITIEREAGLLRIVWQDGQESAYPLRWLRANCPCATCSEERAEAALETNLLRLNPGPPPSTAISDADLVGNYAVRLGWTDGHATGIYTFALLRTAAEQADYDPEKLPPFETG